MSTKIYNAFRINGNSLDEVINKVFKEKSKITQDIEYVLIKKILSESIMLYDRFSLEGDNLILPERESEKYRLKYEDSIKMILAKKYLNHRKDTEEDYEERDFKDVEVNMILYPQPIDYFKEKSYLIQLYGDDDLTSIVKDKYLDKWGVKEYNYWDNTDQPNTITDYEWEMRKNHWKNIDIPLLNGISVTFIKSPKYNVFYMYSSKSEIHHIERALKELNEEVTIETRVQKYMREIKESVAYKEYYDKEIELHNLKNAEKEQISKFLVSKGMSIYFKAIDKVKNDNFTEEEKKEFYEKEQLLRKLLKSNFVLDDFSKKGEDIRVESLLKIAKKMKP